MAVKWTRHRTIIPKSSVVSRSSSPHVSPARCHHRRRHHHAAGHRMEGKRGGISHGTRRAQAGDAVRCQPAACEDCRRSLPSVQPAGNPAGRAARETSGARQPVAAHRGARGLGTTSGGMALGESYYRHALQTPLSHWGQPSRATWYQPQTQALVLAEAFGFHGPINIIANACASGANAIGHAWELVRRGDCERVLTGGYDTLSQLVFSGFDSLQALSQTQCRPFDAHRDGLALGEGAAALTLETLDHAKKRGAKILGE